MARAFLSLLLLYLVLVGSDAYGDIDPCPANSVCAMFVGKGMTCVLEEANNWGYRERGYFRDATTRCLSNENLPISAYEKLYAEIQIEPICARKWDFIVTTYAYKEEQHIGNIVFDFGGAKIRFPNKTTAEFSWKTGKDDWHFSYHSLVEIGEYKFTSHPRYYFLTYSFQIATVDEKLLDLLGVDVLTWHRPDWKLEMKDRRFSAKLRNLSAHKIVSDELCSRGSQMAFREDIDPCPEDRVCAIFVSSEISCTLDDGRWGTRERGYIWDSYTKCDRAILGKLYSALEIEPISVREWKFIVTTYLAVGKQHIENTAFDFGGAKIRFPNRTTTEFSVKSGEHWNTSHHSLVKIDRFEAMDNSRRYVFEQYTFQIESLEENLINLLGVDEFIWTRATDPWKLNMKDRRFSEQLWRLSEKKSKTKFHEDIDRCPANRVCAIFVEDEISCTLEDGSWGSRNGGYLWATNTKCDKAVLGKMHLELEIEPLCLRKWQFTVVSYLAAEKQHIKKIELDFGKAKIRFSNETMTEFSVKRGEHWNFSYHTLLKTDSFEAMEDSRRYHYVQYAFEIESLEENLIDVLGVDELTWTRATDSLKRTMKDRRFSQQLKHLTAQYSESGYQCAGQGMSTGVKVAIAFGICIIVLLIIAVIIYVVWCSRRTNNNTKSASYFAPDFSKKRTKIPKSSKGQTTDKSKKKDTSSTRERTNSASASSPLVGQEGSARPIEA